ncbi:hypothetical protein AGMMS49975_27230 [Clostridia bacterium]|nr:hypothetical protein AGMMS49975_27230 [Clostridia bacterium]
MTYKITIPFTLPGTNQYVGENRRSKYKGNKTKRDIESNLALIINNALRGVTLKTPVTLDYLWVEKNRKRDKDNIAFAHKFIQDALVKSGKLSNDGWAEVAGFSHRFAVDKNYPRVEVEITEVLE